jgi:thymidylate kinase
MRLEGNSGSGKTTLSHAFAEKAEAMGYYPLLVSEFSTPAGIEALISASQQKNILIILDS